MGTDLQGLANSDQPMAQIFVNSFGQKGTLGIWVLIVIIQWVYTLFVAAPYLTPLLGT